MCVAPHSRQRIQDGRTEVRLAAGAHRYALPGCTVAPPWTPAGFALGAREAMTARFPQHAAVIARFTR
ncbi:MAG: hypothetical protein ACKOTF_08840 [Opitutaceae bacterium]